MMSATDSEPTSVEDPCAVKDKEGNLTNNTSSAPHATVPSSTPLVPITTRPNFTNENVIETKAVSMASNDCSTALSSPAEASPAKAVVTPPTTYNETTETSPAVSHIVSASDTLKCTGTSIVSLSESSTLLPVLPSTTFGGPDLETDFPAVLTFKGVSVTLENNSVWKQFNRCGTEMILTKQGRRMFPYCRYRLSGLDPERQYSLVLSIVPCNQYRYRWSVSKWEVTGPAEHQAQGLIRACSHHYSPCKGSDWMNGLVSFCKLKLTNNSQDQEGHIILHSMHRYIPRLHVIPVPDGVTPTPDQPLIMGPESMTFTFPQTEFMAVTTYQNFRITQLKINHNPFAKGFREDGNNSRLNRITTVAQPAVKTDTPPSALQTAELNETKQEVVDLSMKNDTVSTSPANEQGTRLVLKPIMSSSASKDEPYVPCIRGKHALGELVLVQKRPHVEPKEETHAVAITPKVQQSLRVNPKAISMTPTSPSSTPKLSPGYRKKRKRINRHWANSRGREWKAATASPKIVHSPSLTAAMQPELDDVEGLLFVSFTSKEALEVHVKDKPVRKTVDADVELLTTPKQLNQAVEVIPEPDEEKIARLEVLLLQDLQTLKHRHVIHPVLQEVGLKLSSLDPNKSIDLQYLGVHLPLPPPSLPEQGNATSPADAGLPFISRTGKTSDMTKIKGWRNKFIKSKEISSSNCDGSQKNLSAFCSNMLDEYLENEGQYISERAAAFSTNPEGSVAYQLPAKSSSYVKTLDSVLKNRNAAPKWPPGANRPCPLSFKPLLYSALTSPAPPLASTATPQSRQQPASPHMQPGAGTIAKAASVSNRISPDSKRLSTQHPGVSQRSTVSSGQMTHRPAGFTKFQYKLLQMETEAENQGLGRTELTPDRLSVALSVMLTKQMQPNQSSKVAQYLKLKSKGPECGQDFCRLGCVCSSLQHVNRISFHCRQPGCMFGCACFKRKIYKQLTSGESEQQSQPVYSMTNVEHVVQLSPGSHANMLWNRNTHEVDPDPLFAPKSAPLCSNPVKAVKRSSVSRPVQPIREEDKDPVYKYLESMMTCARVREFNSKPPPEITIEPKILDIPTPKTTEKQQKATTDNLPKFYYRTLLNSKKAEKPSQGTIPTNEAKERKQIEIQSGCQWDKDRKRVLETLCRRMNQNRLSQCFSIGPYRIRPVAKIVMQKPSGSLITYRVHISKPSQASDNDEDEINDSEEEPHACNSLDNNTDDDDDEDDDEDEDCKNEEPEMQFGVTPFMSGVLPAGRLRARTKPVGCQASGLIQVNGKSYNQARLLLGNMGSLHPANRLAAYVTGRLNAPADISLKNSQKSDPTNKINTPSALHIKAAGTVVPPIITARKTTELKTPTQAPVQLPQPDSWRKGSINVLQHPQKSSTTNPIQTSSLHRSSVSPFQSSSMSSPVSLTVSPSLKTPSFLGQSGTYSFRICPPANKGSRGQNLPGVTLPGGFTLIQLPKPGADGAAQRPESVSTLNTPHMVKASPPKDVAVNIGHLAANSDANWLGMDPLAKAKDLLSSRSAEPGSSCEVMCEEMMPSHESNETNSKQVDSYLDTATEDLSSDSSDYCGEGDEDEELVDIETVEEVRQGMAIAKMKEALRKALQESRFSSDDFGSAREFGSQDQTDDEHDLNRNSRRRMNHSVLEKQRRSEQRSLFDKLQTVLQTDPRVPRLRLLSLALKEIQNLVETSRFLEEKKRRLTQMQALYLKELSLLSGKPDKLIKHKLEEICTRQKMREKTLKWTPFFSRLLQSRAALLQTPSPESKPLSSPLLQSNFSTASSQPNPHTTAAQSSVNQTPVHTPLSLLSAVSSAASPQAENQPAKPGGPTQVSHSQKECKPQVPSDAATLQVTAAQDDASPTSSAPNSNQPSAHSLKTVSLPLIRSKDGRIILPSSLKPLGNGFYTLVVMNPKKKEENGEVTMQPSDVNLSENQEKSISKSDHPSGLESSHNLEDNKTEQFSNSKPKCFPALQNKSDTVHSVAQQGGAVVGSNKAPAATWLIIEHMHQVPTSVEAQPDSSPPIARRGRGRPRKHPVTPVGENGKQTLLKDNSENVTVNETSILVKDGQSKNSTFEVSKEAPGVVSDNLVPVKRPRGRPVKKKPTHLRTSRVKIAGSSPSGYEDSPVRISRSFRSPDAKPKESPTKTIRMNTSRPLTRAALGKDFPSAKKRSWIDIEKELEPDLESE